MQKNTYDIVIFLVIVSLLVLALVAFILFMLYLYRKRQIAFYQNMEKIKLNHEKNLMAAQLEMQESTFRHISREIHDNINLSLTLAKLQLNTLNGCNGADTERKITAAVELLGQSINDLSDISKSLNSDIIIQQGLLKAVNEEIQRIRQVGLFAIEANISGDPVYLDAQKELVIFRIIQEAFNNIIKHANAQHTELSLHYDKQSLYIAVSDDGNGFDTAQPRHDLKAGLKNMEARVKMLQGSMNISALPGFGTALSFTIPLDTP